MNKYARFTFYFIVFIVVAVLATACGKAEENVFYPPTSPIVGEMASIAEISENREFCDRGLEIEIIQGDAGVISAIRRATGVEPKESDSIIQEFIEVRRDGEVSVYDWASLLEVSPMVWPGDTICVTQFPTTSLEVVGGK